MSKRWLLSALCACLSQVGGAEPAPPTARGTQTDTYHGVPVADPYRWLEEAGSPAVQDWIQAQNAYTEKTMAAWPESKGIEKRVGELALTSARQSAPLLSGTRLFYLKDTPPQAQPVLMAQEWPGGTARAIFDPNQKDTSTAVADYWPSPSGRYLAYATAQGGSEMATLHISDTTTGQSIDEPIPHAGGGTTPASVCWDPDERGVTYVRLPDQSLFHASLWHHRFGTRPDQDTPEFGQGLSAVGEWTLANSSDGRLASAVVEFGDGSPERVYLRSAGRWQEVVGPEALVRGPGHWSGDRFLVVAHDDPQGMGRVLAVKADGQKATVVPAGPTAIQEVAPLKDELLIASVEGPDWQIRHLDASGKLVRTLPLPAGVGVNGIASSDQSPAALISYDGWSTPARWDSYAGGVLTNVFAVKPAADYSHVKADRLTATSADGTKIPITVLHLDTVSADGNRPTILTAYGGFGVCTAPHFLGGQLAWLERGGVLAVANIRGGGEFGEHWHQHGMLAHKQNCFDDFSACGRALVDGHWTQRDRLGIQGGSNGGLLMGATLTQHPEQFRAVMSFVGIYDMLRNELWPNGTYNITEYGTVQDPDGFRTLSAYSPLHHVKPGTAYPAVLLETGENDPRVAPWQSRKFAATLQAANRSSHPVMCLTHTNAGHGMGATFSQRLGRTTLALTFFAHELGLDGR